MKLFLFSRAESHLNVASAQGLCQLLRIVYRAYPCVAV